MDDFFKYVSKGVIVFPIVIIILSLILKYNQPAEKKISSSLSPVPTVYPSSTVINKAVIDLKGPWVCQYKNNNQEYSLKIKDRKISLEIKEAGQTKKSDLSQYAGMIESFLSYDITQLESMVKPYLPEGTDLKSLLNSCTKGK